MGNSPSSSPAEAAPIGSNLVNSSPQTNGESPAAYGEQEKRLEQILQSPTHETPLVRVDNMTKFLHKMAAQGKAEETKAFLRRISGNTAGSSCLSQFGSITPADVKAAISLFEQDADGSSSTASATQGSQVKEDSANSLQWETVCEAEWLQAPRKDAPKLGVLPKGRRVSELTHTTGWVAIEPRGWVARSSLRACVQNGAASMITPRNTCQSKRTNGVARMEVEHGKRSLCPEACELASRKRSRTENSGHSVNHHGQSSVQSQNPKAIFVLDALNLMRHVNNELNDLGTLNWEHLRLAGLHYKNQGNTVYAFIRHTSQWDPKSMEVRKLLAALGSDFIVRCPAGACDDKFMIRFAQDLESNSASSGDATSSNSAGEKVQVRIVTNDQFRDHKQVSKAWVQEHTIKYAFAAGRFLPEQD